MGKNIEPYYVILWATNKHTVEHYDIMPYLIEQYRKDKKSKSQYAKHPKTFDEIKQFILDESRHQFWSRCEYEVIVSAWPHRPKRNDDGSIKMADYTAYIPEKEVIHTIDFYDYKLDAYEQIEMNINVITQHFIQQILKSSYNNLLY